MLKGAYLNGRLMEELFMKQPIGFEAGTGWVVDFIRKILGQLSMT
jgi:hypothetical protein